jgi:hypothetical protein
MVDLSLHRERGVVSTLVRKEEVMAKVQEIAKYIRDKLRTEQKVSLNELGERFPMPSEEFDAVRRLMSAEGCIEVAIPGDRWIVRP